MVTRREGRGAGRGEGGGQGRGRAAALAGVTAGGIVLGLLVSGCALRGPAAGEAPELRDSMKSLSGQARQAGDEADPGRARAAVRAAARTLTRAGRARVRTSMETVSGGTRLTIHGAGGYDFARPAGHLTVLVPEDAAGAAEHRPITELFSPGALFMKNRGAGVPPDKWVQLATASLADGNLLTNGATDPLAAAELLGGAREVTYMRDERVGGVRVRHYWGTIDLGRAVRAAPVRDRGPLATAAKGFSSGTVAFDAYLDDEGRPRRLRHRFSVASTGPSAPRAPMTVTSTVELYDFGADVDVDLPDAADIYAGTVASPRN